ncbi:MAG: phosphoribosylaminoimidazolesuccinocarboxamide synthase [Nitrospiraceae bacterium]|nr:phosphoribosylaminoimidazolesuccinocarboxamide synthase [Nitrospiraceae bacterium]
MVACAMKAVEKTEIEGAPKPRRGKVRDVYDLGDKLIIVATDRVSAFDVILPDAIAEKGKILTAISLFWFRQTEDIIENHIISADVKDFPPPFNRHRELLEGRSILTKKAQVLPVECIVRGYLSGSGWKSYRETGSVCGIKLPEGLKESSRLPEPIFTPSTKAAEGHDVNISFEECQRTAGTREAGLLKDYTLKIYERALSIAAKKGIIIADTKMEFGLMDGRIILIDELLTPDSSRFWSAQGYREGAGQDSFDKQIIRDALLAMGWDMLPPAPRLPEEVLLKATERYREILKTLTS